MLGERGSGRAQSVVDDGIILEKGLVTLVVAVTGQESIWMLADRRLSWESRPPRDDACKIMVLNTTDGVAILGYAGLGATARETEPSDWMSRVLRGVNLPQEESLEKLGEAMCKQLPTHIANLRALRGPPQHHVVVSAFRGKEPRIYLLGLALAPNGKVWFRRVRPLMDAIPTTVTHRSVRLGIAGSGAFYLERDRSWLRPLLRMVKANDPGRVSPNAVADQMAKLNDDVHHAVQDGSVGPRCMVVRRWRKGGVQDGGGGQQFYSGKIRESSSVLPSIWNGRDMKVLLGAIMPSFQESLRRRRSGESDPELDMDEVNRRLALLPEKPEEDLR